MFLWKWQASRPASSSVALNRMLQKRRGHGLTDCIALEGPEQGSSCFPLPAQCYWISLGSALMALLFINTLLSINNVHFMSVISAMPKVRTKRKSFLHLVIQGNPGFMVTNSWWWLIFESKWVPHNPAWCSPHHDILMLHLPLIRLHLLQVVTFLRSFFRASISWDISYN